MKITAYIFEAKFLQGYIFATNKLKEIIGASEQLLELTNLEQSGLLGKCLDALSIRDNIYFSRCAGGSFYAFSHNEQAIDQLANLWPIVVQQFAPGMSFVDGKGFGDTEKKAFETARDALFKNLNTLYPTLPAGNPFVARAPRTGTLATKKTNTRGNKVLIDLPTAKKLKAFDSVYDRESKFFESNDNLTFPVNLSPEEDDEASKNFPYSKAVNRIALIHADGNGMGQLLMDLRAKLDKDPKYAEIFLAFSQALETATIAATKQAISAVIVPQAVDSIVPARPIILGGDDLTIIVRADLAVAFTKAFLLAFEAETLKEISSVWKKFDINISINYLTACAGIVYAKPSQPIAQLAHLAESLCQVAKKHSKEVSEDGVAPSSMSFYRLTSSQIEDYATILESNLSVQDGNTQYVHTIGAYAVKDDNRLKTIDQLIVLSQSIKNQNRNSVFRQLLGNIGVDTPQAKKDYARWQQLMKDRKQDIDSIKNALSLFGIHENSDLPYTPAKTKDSLQIRTSPIGDVQTLLSENDALATVQFQG